MAWPVTPLTTYLPGSLPPVKSSDLNAIQSAINRAFLGTYSYFGLVLDGAGGSAVTPPAGSLSASGSGIFGGSLSAAGPIFGGGVIGAGSFITVGASRGGTSAPTPAISKNALYVESCLLAFALIDPAASGNLRYGFNIQSVVYGNPNTPSQAWEVTLGSPGSASTMLACAFSTGNVPTIASAAVLSSGIVQIQTFTDGQSTPSQHPCGLLVFGT